MEIINVIPRGYCQGVVRAIKIAKDTAEKYSDYPISMLGMLVHNQYVVNECKHLGIHCLDDKKASRLDLLDKIDSGVVIITAHGASEEVYQKAKDKGLIVVDATCPDVMKTHVLVKEHVKDGDVIYIGKKNHPEAEGTVGLSNHIHLVTEEKDLDNLGDLHNVLITCQTTLSLLDTNHLIQKTKEKFKDAKVAPEICNATRIRQEAVLNLKNIDVLYVVGDPHSNNTNQLKKSAEKVGIPNAYLIENANDIEENQIKGKNRVAVTSGSSTPTALTNDVVSVLKKYAETGILDKDIPIPAHLF